MSKVESPEITGLLLAWRGGDPNALTELLPAVYQQLKKIAGHLIRKEREGHTLDTTALVHEAYLRLLDFDRISWKDRAHFFAMCARIMRRVLVDHARRQVRSKRGGGAQRAESVELRRLPSRVPAPQVLALDEALGELSGHDEEMVRVVELRFFGGLGREEIAEALGISSATVTRRWRSARAWLINYMQPEAA